MNSKQKRTLAAIFEEPTRTNIVWNDIESLFISLGAEISEGSGSRVRIAINGGRGYFHRPHPNPTTDRGALRSVRTFLINVGVEPE